MRVWGGKRKADQGAEDRVRWVGGVFVKQQVGMWLGGGDGRGKWSDVGLGNTLGLLNGKCGGRTHRLRPPKEETTAGIQVAEGETRVTLWKGSQAGERLVN